MAALLSACIGDTDSVVKYINEARELGIEILPPDVNESGYKFTVIGDKQVRFGLGAIRNVGRTAIDSILAARKEGPITSLNELCEKVDLRMCNKRVFEALIGAGALDNLGGHRAQYAKALDDAIAEAALKQEEKASGQVSLFGDPSSNGGTSSRGTKHELPVASPWPESERLQKEKEILGFYISGHPLEPYRTECELFASHTVAQLGTWTGEPMTLGVVITAVKKQISKKSGAEFARLTVEDFAGSSEVLVFPEAWANLSHQIRVDVPVLLKGGYSKRDQGGESPTFIVETVTPLAAVQHSGQVAIAIQLALGAKIAPEIMEDVRSVVEAHPGPSALELHWSDGNGSRARLRSRSLKLSATNAALTELRAVLGQERVKLVRGG
jgi:DNA polymerase III subunit alpha